MRKMRKTEKTVDIYIPFYDGKPWLSATSHSFELAKEAFILTIRVMNSDATRPLPYKQHGITKKINIDRRKLKVKKFTLEYYSNSRA